MQIINRTYETFEDARNVVVRLEANGIASDRISLIGRQATGETNTTDGAAVGGTVGGVGGLLAGLGIVALPGIGPVAAVGWLASTLAGAGVGALAGGLIGALADAGIEQSNAGYYAETVRRGGTLLSVRVEDAEAEIVRAIMDAGMPIDETERRRIYERDGWTGMEEPPRGPGSTIF